jgi:arabinan endo-1,5-alpha-L-arabinosidase
MGSQYERRRQRPHASLLGVPAKGLPPIHNPVIRANCADPAILAAGDRFYVVCTSNDNQTADKFPLRRSSDLVAWEEAGFLFPRGRWPEWARRDFWAPEIHRVGERWLAYFTARDTTGILCLGVASADRVEGPWTDLGRPFLRDERVGLIDAHLFQDEDGRRYLYWKVDGNGLTPPEPSVLYGQEVAPDGLTLVGERVTIMTNDRSWEGEVVEGPWVVRRQGACFLFYAGNTFNSDRYATGVARAAAPLGPFEKHPEPILRSNARWSGPGHGSVLRLGDEDLFVYHAWEPDRIDERWDASVHPRMMLIDRIEWSGDWPRIHDGTPS